MKNKKRHRRNSDRDITDMNPTLLRQCEDADIKTADDNTNENTESDNSSAMSEVPKETGAETMQLNNGKRAKCIVNTVLCGAFFIFVIAGMIISVSYMTSDNRQTYSEYEKRLLEQIPEFSFSSLTSGSYTKGIDSFFSDNFPMRENLVKSATVLKRFHGIRAFRQNAKHVVYGDTDIYTDGEMEILIDENKFNDAEKIVIPGIEADLPLTLDGKNDLISVILENMENNSDMPSLAEETQNGEVVISEYVESSGKAADEAQEVFAPTDYSEAEKSKETEKQNTVPAGDKRDTIYILGDTAYEYFRGSIKSSSDYINVINTYAKYIPENVNIYTLVIPTHPEFGLSGADRTVSNEQKPIIEHIGNNLSPRVTFVNPHAKLLEAYSAGEYLYFRTDHHWTVRGAYQAYREFCERADISPIPSENYVTGRIEPFLGTFYSASKQEKALAVNPDYVEYFEINIPCTVTRYDKNDKSTKGKLYYKSVRGKSNGYLAFMGGDFPYVHIKTENANGKKLMIFKESFGNPLIGLLAPHFEEVHVADIRYFKYNSVNFIKQYGITDVLFCNGIMSANSKARVNNLMELMNK